MNKGPSKPVKVENVFAQGFDALEEAEKKAKKDAKRAVKKAEREAAAEVARAEAAANPQPVEEKPKVKKEKISWADCDEDDDLGDLGMSPFNDKFEQEYNEKLLDEADVSSDDADEDGDDDMASSPIVNTDFAASQAEAGETKQLSKKEQKQKEMDDLDALLNEMGVENEVVAEEVKEAAPAVEADTEGKKKRSRGGKKKKAEAEAPSEEAVAVVAAPADIAKIMAAKGKKKGGSGKSAVELAAAEAKKRKNKDGGKKKDTSNYNQMPSR